MTEIQRRLFDMADEDYRQFNAGLIPTVAKQRFIGVRTPALRAYAKELRGSAQARAFLRELPHRYFEENNLHALLLAEIRDYAACLEALEAFLPHVDNWATCDQLKPRVLGRHTGPLLEKIRLWLASPHCYTQRYAIGLLMDWYLGENFLPAGADMVAEVQSEEYYVRMMAAWYFATALAKNYDEALPYLRLRRLPEWTHNKAIQKALESRRVTPEHKQVLRALKIK